MKATFRKSWAGNLLMWSDLNLKVLITRLLLVLEVCNVKPTYRNSSNVVKFDLGPLLQRQTRIAKFKSVYNSLIIGPRGLQCENNL